MSSEPSFCRTGRCLTYEIDGGRAGIPLECKVTKLAATEPIGQWELEVMHDPSAEGAIKRLAELGVARISYGPISHIVAMDNLGKQANENFAS